MTIDFLAGIVETGAVHGVDADLDPSVVHRVFGECDHVNVNGLSFWWGYGILEIFWDKRESGHGVWGTHFTAQAHRLDPPLRWTALSGELARRGVEMVELPPRQPDQEHVEYFQPVSKIMVMVRRSGGEIHNVQSRFQMLYPDHDWGAWDAVKQSLKHALTLSPDERVAWIERGKPAENVAAWWHYRCRVITGHSWSFGTLPDRADWVKFAFWAWGHAGTLGVPSAVVAREVAAYSAILEDLHPEFDRPSADSLVRPCLEHLTGAMDRSDKDLIAAAALHRHAIQAPALVAGVDQWIAKRADLPSVSLRRC
ncbi:hypothetical protein ALI144C_34585 [Actinosynnema sp. ALI-1.44]|uniref:hypothetical protein n=1 Tax=Actinosynnema sp. ALI-1.44 TaxID=1933779 RepID=UPI00097BEB14|nr:hypothetical protein [Actinosynnema sp. ALI-1.44]ONI77207.1 hypothetical protein ALI144C_34585 [Actinosynnema sp. ALI-1.44]